MELHFLGTGHWRSKDRNPTCLYLKACGYNILFECPINTKELLKQNKLVNPDVVFTSSLHPHAYNEQSLREISSPGMKICVMHGLKVGGLSVKTKPLGEIKESIHKRILGFEVLASRNRRLLSYAPNYTKLPKQFTDARCVILGDNLSSISPSETQRIIVAQKLTNIYLVNINEPRELRLHENYNNIRIPNDGEVISMSNAGIYLHRPALANLITEGKLSSVIKSSPFENYVNKPIFLCSEDGVHAKITLSEGKEIDREGFRDNVSKHGMLESEAVELWPGFASLYLFDVTINQKFEESLDYTPPSNYRAFIEDIDIDYIELDSSNDSKEVETKEEGDTQPSIEEDLTEIIRKEDNAIVLYDKSGEKVLGRFPFGEGEKYADEESAREAAKEREKEVQALKHMKENEDETQESQKVIFLDINGNIRVINAIVRETVMEDTGDSGLFIEEV